SVGGAVAIDFTLAHPERVWALALVSPAVPGAPAPHELDHDLEALFDHLDELESAGDVEAVNDLEARIWLDGPSRRGGAVGGGARRLSRAMNGAALAAPSPGEEAVAAGNPAWARLAQIAVPVLVVVGTHDLPHVVERSGQVAGAVRHGRFHE